MILYWIICTLLGGFALVIGYAMSMRYPRPCHGDPNVIYDPWPEDEKQKPFMVTYTKVLRARAWWETIVVGHYRWYWSAKLHAVLFDKFILGSGAIYIRKKRK
jgi:hypothetical protein